MPRVEWEQLSLFELGPNMSEIRKASAALKRATRARSTQVSYESDWRGFQAWCDSAGRRALPADGDTLALYVTARLQGGLRVSSAERHVAAVAYRHKAEGMAVPDRAEARMIMVGARRQRKERPFQRAALAPGDLARICKKLLAVGTVLGVRDRALLTLGFVTGLRRSNLVALNLADVRFVPRKGVAVTVGASKTDQTGRGQVIGVFRGARVETCPVRALRAWLELRGDDDGPLFTRVRAGGRPELGRLNPDTVNQVLKASVAAIGLDPALYGGHSLRAGCITAAANGGASHLAIMERSGHTTVEMVRRYCRNVDPFAGGNLFARAL
jgi:integrase